MSLQNEQFSLLHNYIDKEIMPFVCNRINRRFNIIDIRKAAEQSLGIEIKTGLIASLLRQRGVHDKEIKGISHFEISNEFFIEQKR